MKYFLLAIVMVRLWACTNDKNKPDVSDIKIDVPFQRFERDFFSIDTTDLKNELAKLRQLYPGFLPIYLSYVLGIDKKSDTATQIKFFLSQSQGLYDSVANKYKSTTDIKRNIEEAFQYVKYYYPNYAVPKVITLLGPVDALAKLGDTYTPNFLGPDFLGISLQFYLGKHFSLYQSEPFITNVAPLYRSRRFDKVYIVADAMQLIVDDIYPDQSVGRPLIEQMVEKGKAWYLLDRFLPDAPDSVKTGYTTKQLNWAKENEGNIWGYLLKNENPYSIEPHIIQTYIGEAPFTQNMSEASPGNIGQWIGWRIVQKFADENEKLSLAEILATPARQVFEQSKYKPK